MGLSCSLSPPGAPTPATETDEQIVPTSCGSTIIEVSREVLCRPGTESNYFRPEGEGRLQKGDFGPEEGSRDLASGG